MAFFRFIHDMCISIWLNLFLILFAIPFIFKFGIIAIIILVFLLICWEMISSFVDLKAAKYMDKFWEKNLQIDFKVHFDKHTVNFPKNNLEKINFHQFGICPYYVYSTAKTVIIDKNHGYRYDSLEDGVHCCEINGGYQNLYYPSVAERIKENGKLYDQCTIEFKKTHKIDIDDLQSKFKDL